MAGGFHWPSQNSDFNNEWERGFKMGMQFLFSAYNLKFNPKHEALIKF